MKVFILRSSIFFCMFLRRTTQFSKIFLTVILVPEFLNPCLSEIYAELILFLENLIPKVSWSLNLETISKDDSVAIEAKASPLHP